MLKRVKRTSRSLPESARMYDTGTHGRALAARAALVRPQPPTSRCVWPSYFRLRTLVRGVTAAATAAVSVMPTNVTCMPAWAGRYVSMKAKLPP